MNRTIDKKKLILLGRLFAVIVLAVTVIGYKPYMKMRAKNSADRFLSENYPVIYRQVKLTDMGETVYYRADEKDWAKQGWWLYYNNPSDDFMYFSIITDKKGNMVFDGCGDRYLKGGTIYDHYDYEFCKLISELMKKEFGVEKADLSDIPADEIDGSIHFKVEFVPKTYPEVNGFSNYGYTGPVLDVNKKYTTRELALKYGHIYIAFTGDEGGYEKGAKQAFDRYMQIKDWVEKNHIPFKEITIGRNFNEGLRLTYDEFSDYRYTDDFGEKYIIE